MQQDQPATLAPEHPRRVTVIVVTTWVGERKRFVGAVTLAAALLSVVVALLLPNRYTARATLMAPAQQQSSANVTAALATAAGAAGQVTGALLPKTPDELYLALLRSDSVLRGLDERFKLRQRYDIEKFERLRTFVSSVAHIQSERKSGLISVEITDKEPQFAANLANGYAEELTRVMSRLAVTDAQQRRAFFEGQLQSTKQALVKAEQQLRAVQEHSGMLVPDKQAEAILLSMAKIRTEIAEREAELHVLRTGATEQNPQVMRLSSAVQALRQELARMESSSGAPPTAVDFPAGKIPEAATEYIRARREVRLQEMMLEGLLRQFEAARLDEAREGPAIQRVDIAQPPDGKSGPWRSGIVLGTALLAFMASSAWVVVRRRAEMLRASDPERAGPWTALRQAWRWKR